MSPRVFPPCPGWCEVDHTGKDDHDIEFGARIHDRNVWYLPREDDPDMWRVGVRLTSCDSADGHREPLHLDVVVDDNGLSPAEARVLAIAILTGLDLCEDATPR